MVVKILNQFNSHGLRIVVDYESFCTRMKYICGTYKEVFLFTDSNMRENHWIRFDI